MALDRYFADLKLNSGCRRFSIVEDRALSTRPPTQEEIAEQEFHIEDLIRISAAAKFSAAECAADPPSFPMRQMSQTIDFTLLESSSSFLSSQGSSSILSLRGGLDTSSRSDGLDCSLGNSGKSLGFTNSSIDDSYRSCGSLYSVTPDARGPSSQVLQMLLGNQSSDGTEAIPMHLRRTHLNFGGSRSK